MTALTFDPPRTCGWCLTAPATMMLYATASCISCACATSKERVSRWQRAVNAGKKRAA